MENVVIIGSGCAGWTAALYTARANLKPLVLTGAQPGGLLTTTSIVENYPGFPEGVDGTELMMRMQQQAERFGANTQYGVNITKVDFSARPFKLWADEELIESKAVIIAVGASHRHIGLTSEATLERKGVTYCATCDGALPMFRNQPLVVVGGGDSACEEAHYLTHFASKVYLFAATNFAPPKSWPTGSCIILRSKWFGTLLCRTSSMLHRTKSQPSCCATSRPTLSGKCHVPGCLWPLGMFPARRYLPGRLRWITTATSSAGREPTPMLPVYLLREIAWIAPTGKPSLPPALAVRRRLTQNVGCQRRGKFAYA